MDFRKNILSGMISGVAGYILKVGVNLFIVPLVIRYLGAEDYGFYVFLFGFAELLMALDMGVMNGLIQRISHYQAVEAHDKKREQLLIGHLLFACGAFLLIIAAFPAAWRLGAFFHLKDNLRTIAPTAFLLVFWNTAANLYGCYFQAVLKSHCLHRWISVNDTAQVIISSVLTILLLMSGHGIVEIFIARLLVTILNTLVYMVRAVRIEPGCLKLSAGVSLAGVRDLFGISAFVLLDRISQLLSRQLDTMLIARFLSMAEVGLYGFVSRIFSYLMMIVWQMIDVMFPVFTRLSADLHHLEQARRFYLRISALICFLVSGMILMILGLFPEIVHILGAGKIPLESAWRLAWFVFPAIWMDAVAALSVNYLFASGNPRQITMLTFLAAGINFLLSLALVRQLGFIGPAIATACINVLFHQCVTIVLACRKLNLPWLEFVRHVYLRNLPPLLVAVALTFASRRLYETGHQLPILMGGLALALAVSALLWLAVSATAWERRLLWERIPSLPRFFMQRVDET